MRTVANIPAQSAEEVIQEMVRRIVSQFRPERIILFGSHARGTAGPDSDVDLLVVMPVSGSRRKLAVEIEAAITGMGFAKDVIVVTSQEVERDRHLTGTMIESALTEGKILYDHTA